MDEATRLPVKTEKRAPVAAPAQWMSFESLRCEIDRIFNSFRLGIPFRRPLDVELPWRRETNWGIAPAFDVAEKDKEYEITATLPGMDEKNIEIKLSNGTLTIWGEKKKEKEELEKDYCLSERRYISFTRSFQLPVGVDTRKIEAAFANGILTVKLPKTAEGWFSAIVIAALLIMGLVAYV
ncbi:MAG: molecular chaperone Hsp20 [Beijerinckiaceae bacterium]|nr:MAG: molecular chaperone Hsp20 [Beijerinckiaceae bacterium]